MSFYEYSSAQRAEFGMKDNLVRYATGIEDEEDLIADLEQALARIAPVNERRMAAAPCELPCPAPSVSL